MKKILISADCNGNFEILFNKVSDLNEKNSFDLLLMLGNVCPPSSCFQMLQIRQNRLQIKIPAYFIDYSEIGSVLEILHPSGCQISRNFFFLGKFGLKKIQTLTIAYINGKNIKKEDVQKLIQLCNGQLIDILMTNQWPKGISQLQQNQLSSCQLVNKLCLEISPHYHLSSTNKDFFRLQPFINNNGNPTHFINVAPIKQKENLKNKYLYAIKINPMNQQKPDLNLINLIPNPFKTSTEQQIKKYSHKNQLINTNQQIIINEYTSIYFEGFPSNTSNNDIYQFMQRWGNINKIQVFKKKTKNILAGIIKFMDVQSTKQCCKDTGKYLFCQQIIKFYPRSTIKRQMNNNCWFCISNQKFNHNLVLYRGKFCFISLDKGPITDSHLQIVPYNHVNTIGKLNLQEIDEINFFKQIIKNHLNSLTQQVIFYERCIPLLEEINHSIIHVIGIKDTNQNIIKKFQHLNSENNYGFKLYNGSIRTFEYYIQLTFNDIAFIKQVNNNKKSKIQVDFIRKIICELIDQPIKVNWRQCQLTKNQSQQCQYKWIKIFEQLDKSLSSTQKQ